MLHWLNVNRQIRHFQNIWPPWFSNTTIKNMAFYPPLRDNQVTTQSGWKCHAKHNKLAVRLNDRCIEEEGRIDVGWQICRTCRAEFIWGNMKKHICHKYSKKKIWLWLRIAGQYKDPEHQQAYRKTSSTSRTKSQSLNVSCILAQLSSFNPLKPGVKLRMKM